MSGGMLPASVYGLRVPAGGIPIPGNAQFPATFRITMAAIDPSADPQREEPNQPARATLKLIRERVDFDDDSEDDEDDEDFDEDSIEAIKARLAGVLSDEDEDMSDDDEDSENEKNGGPSDPAKAKQVKKEAMTKKLQAELDEMELDGLTNGVNGKGKGKASEDDDSEEDLEIDSDEEDDDEVEELVLCTLDPEKNYQQPLDITVGEHEEVYFVSSGTHDIFITGNYVLPPDDEHDDYDDEDDYEEGDYDLSPDEDELDGASDSEEDELDGLEDPRITEVDSEEEEAPKLVAAKKGKNKRPAESEEDLANLDDLISRATKADSEEKSKKQAKKIKKNDGQAVAVEPAKKDQKEDKKKVQFAKNLELGPTGSPKVEEPKKDAAPSGPRTVQGVLIDDKKVGKGKAAKKGDKVEMRYIGKLKSNGKQFDANKKGKPFAFKLGVGEVIKGWDIGVAGMTAGGERRLTIPANLAYGKRGAPPDIPGNADLVFDIKCISIH
ncbi:hypothetical protein BU24DRAFT_425730 [Aaosphaeria arxii CBS 175.79]|uniref:peptidylprolyl isomerase n=1 Tax=Aaosphaeria arxii CBS 175.79 TaxID=1450172 RepID=A0A6A5XGB4_9PLEO|nr:uncharacterized protein BU24DRAFT_425730 [Aaosphaeria arxii CBS 175.79]KAF2011899.1 hypothetical protein BU24DRAFT_425730 [Aaosphaeria arxii CBS 175.79]